MKKSTKMKLTGSSIYALVMIVFNIIKDRFNIDFIELVGDFILYFIAFFIAQYLTDILFEVKEKK